MFDGKCVFLPGFIILIFLMHYNSFAQNEESNLPAFDLYINTVFDTAQSNREICKTYFTEKNDSILQSSVSSDLKISLQKTLESLTINSLDNHIIQGDLPPKDSIKHTAYLLKITIYVDDNVSLFINYSINNETSKKETLEIPETPFIKTNYDEVINEDDWEKLNSLPNTPEEFAKHLQSFATTLSKKIKPKILHWFISKSIKFRVKVEAFKNLNEDNKNLDYLEKTLRAWIYTELNKSEAISLYDSQKDTSKLLLNYIIDGDFVEIGRQLSINVRCKNNRTGLLLVSKRVIIDTINASNISREMVEIVNQIRYRMETDFHKSVKTIAVVGQLPSKLFSYNEIDYDAAGVIEEVARTISQKLRLLSMKNLEKDSTKSSGILKLQVLDNSDQMTTSASKPNPSEILAGLDADYLFLISYQDQGDKVRLSSTLYSFDSERPSAANFTNEETFDKSELNLAINNTVIKLMKYLCRYGFLSSDVACDPIGKGITVVDSTIDKIEMHTILQDAQIGIRVGGVVNRASSELFLGRKSGTYFEAFYSRMVPFLSSGLDGGLFDVGFEMLFGLDLGGNFSLRGPTVSNSFLNVKIFLTRWQYSKNPFNFLVGGGIGTQALRYVLSPGDDYFHGDKYFKDTAFKFNFDLFAEFEFPLWKEFDIDVVYRYIPTSTQVTTFENAPIESSEKNRGPIGRLGASYFIGGLKYKFH